ncbi:MAG: PadR family transcriptional regulator [Microbacteriaceae bacterium]
MTPPVFAYGHLRLYILSLLAESETGMHGYELIQALGDRFGGTYLPSAGTIYPRLAKLESEGHVEKTADGRKTVYSITASGRSELAARETELDDIEDGVTDSIRRLADEVRSSVNDAMRTLKADLAATARDLRDEQHPAAASGSRTTSSPRATSSPRVDGRSTAHDHPRVQPNKETSPPETSPGAQSRLRLQRADMALQSFRHDVRSDLRSHVSSGELSEESVTVLIRRLDELRAELLASFDK